MNNFRSNLNNWIKENIDFALLLAVFTETPRWAVAFMAVNEPLWVGVPLGVLLAFATSHAWRTYFETRNQSLFIFNVVSVGIAVAVIAPVLFAMTSKEAQEVNVASILPVWMTWIWSTLLALTTFMPLVQLAAVQGLKAHTEQPAPKRVTRTVRDTRTVEQSEQYTVVQPEQLPVIVDEQPAAIVPVTTEQKRAALAEMLRAGQRLNKTKLAQEWQVGRTTLYAWIDELQEVAQ